MQTSLRLVTLADLPQVQQLIHEGQATLKANGIPQWQDGYPDQATLINDINEHMAYALVDEQEQFIGYAAVRQSPEPNYKTPLTGTWPVDSEPYVSIHRFVIGQAFQGQHQSIKLFNQLFTRIKQLGFQYARIDTHAKNQAMQQLILKVGFTYACTIAIDGDTTDQRLAYTKHLNMHP
ncbi:RimJ/RimL family protein N-acetyltransferase [Weissella uvarum]|uniref:GNAT family N-acetyltransferase n=1 Tax=Weissella uvarum TaxID=1479233 RepID=UPI00196068DF|nr:GNAT family N-acetyltransferase [Weissella uvarum]MBM7616838.1 RimJ/RimL family protein N-acetyltransferase [Weissella uvarum]MCM0594710.1 GNAT family N-acetyltransferase [Weissella uvarum]